jgi:ribosomal protein S18 acetylase RimI-like enzyme
MAKFIEVKAEENDRIEEILEIEKGSLGINGAIDIWTLKPLVRYGKVFAMIEDGVIVSAGEFIQKFESKEVYLYGVSTKVGYWGKGYARELLEKSMEYFAKIGMEKMSLTVAAENERALELYKKLGYNIEGIHKNEYGKDRDRVYMIKKII